MTDIIFPNCGFETADLTGWSSYSDGDARSNLTISATAKYYGNYGLEMLAHITRPDTGNVQAWIKRIITINAGDTFKFAYKVLNSSVSDSSQDDRKRRLLVKLYRGSPYWDSDTIIDDMAPAVGDWIEVEHTPAFTGSEIELHVVVFAVDAPYT